MRNGQVNIQDILRKAGMAALVLLTLPCLKGNLIDQVIVDENFRGIIFPLVNFDKGDDKPQRVMLRKSGNVRFNRLEFSYAPDSADQGSKSAACR